MAITFRYKRIERPAPLEAIHAPAIPITLVAKETLDVIALIDSGADVTAIPKGIAEILGIDLSGEREEVVGIGGTVSAIKTTVSMSIKNAHEKYNFPIHVFVVLDDKGDDFPILLGREGFFDNFEITFKENQKKVVLRKVES